MTTYSTSAAEAARINEENRNYLEKLTFTYFKQAEKEKEEAKHPFFLRQIVFEAYRHGVEQGSTIQRAVGRRRVWNDKEKRKSFSKETSKQN